MHPNADETEACCGSFELPLAALHDEEGLRIDPGLPPVVDAHVHLFPDGFFEAIWRWFSKYGWPIRYQLKTPEVIGFLRARGVSHIVALAYAHKPGTARLLNAYLAEVARQNPDVTALATVLPGEEGAAETLEEAHALGLKGVKLHCHVQRFSPDDEALEIIYETCARLRLPIVMHAGREPRSAAYPVDPHLLCAVERVERVLRAHPTLQLSVPHFGADEIEGYGRLLERHPNLHLDSTMMLADFFPVRGTRRLFDIAPDRLMYGTDFPNLPYAWDRELTRVRRIGLSDEALAAFLGGMRGACSVSNGMRSRFFVGVVASLLSGPFAFADVATPPPSGHGRVQEVAGDDSKTLATDSDDDDCRDHRHRLCRKDKDDIYGFVGFGFRGATTSTTGVPAAGGTTSLQVVLNMEALASTGISSSRFRQDLAIGGGSAGFDGLWRGSFMSGVRPEIVRGQGPFVRLGFGWQLAGNDRHYASYLELPRAELGYQIGAAPFTFEIGARGAAMLTGAFHFEDEKRHTGTTPDVGVFALLGFPGIRIEADAVRIFSTTRPGGDIDMLNGSACLAYGILLCGDASYYRSNVRLVAGPGDARAAATYIGITLGVGLGGPSSSFD